jgi:hypothetical protein
MCWAFPKPVWVIPKPGMCHQVTAPLKKTQSQALVKAERLCLVVRFVDKDKVERLKVRYTHHHHHPHNDHYHHPSCKGAHLKVYQVGPAAEAQGAVHRSADIRDSSLPAFELELVRFSSSQHGLFKKEDNCSG